MSSESELLNELKRLNRTGIINDEEFLVLRKIIRNGSGSPDFYRRFDRLFAGSSKIIPEETKKKKRVLKPEVKSSAKDERLYSFDEAISELNLKLTTRSGEEVPRELLSCPACGLFESVTTEGNLITAEFEYPGIDTSLRFLQLKEGDWECPDCGLHFPGIPVR